MSHTAHPPAPHPHEHPVAATAKTRQPWLVLSLLALAEFMVILDVTVVNVALPSIGKDLSFAPRDLQWVISAYVLFTGGLMLLGGRMADLLGRRQVFLTGLLVFTGASLASGLATTSTMLVVARAVQGLGAALLLPSALSIVTTTYSGKQRGTALAVWGVLGSAGAAAGVLLGGVLTTLLSWEWVFFINIPIGFVVALGTLRVVPSAPLRRPALAELDIAGAVTVMAGLVSLVVAIEGTSTHGWGSPRTLLLAAVAAVLLGAFAVIERAARSPLVAPSTWRVRSLVSSAVVMFGATGILVGTFFLNTLYLQRVLDASALEAGLAFLPLALVIVAAAHAAGHLLQHLGSRLVIALGLLLMAGGALLLAAAPDHARYATDLLPAFLVIGFGVGLVFVSVSVTAMSEISHRDAGLASGLMTTAHEVGAAFGVAVLGAVATGGSAGLPAAGLADGYQDGFLVAAGVALVLALVALVSVPSFRPAPGAAVSMH
jgi:EmrB/QacA subfamily drug resistance transporter